MGVILTPMTLLKARMGELSVGLLFSVFSHAPTPNTQKYVCLHIYYYFCFINAHVLTCICAHLHFRYFDHTRKKMKCCVLKTISSLGKFVYLRTHSLAVMLYQVYLCILF